MGIYYTGGVVYGYRVNLEDLHERFGEDDTAYYAAEHYGVGHATAGHYEYHENEQVVFTAPYKNNYVEADSSSSYGFTKVDELDTSTEGLEQLMEDLDGELGFYAFFTVG